MTLVGNVPSIESHKSQEKAGLRQIFEDKGSKKEKQSQYISVTFLDPHVIANRATLEVSTI
jgi:hypothetical protein